MFQYLMRWSCVVVALLLVGNGALAEGGIISGGVPDATFSGFELWLDAGDLDANGVADGNADGTTFSSWKNKVNSYVAGSPSSTVGNSPTINVIEALNDMPVAWMDRVALEMPHNDSLNPGEDPWYVFAVGTSMTSNASWVRKGNLWSSGKGWSIIGAPTGIYVRVCDSSGDKASQSLDDLTSGDFRLVTMELSGVSEGVTPTVTGALLGYTGSWNAGGCGPTEDEYATSVGDSSPLYVGRDDQKSQVAEILVYRGALTETEIADVTNYLGVKYGMIDVPEPGVFIMLFGLVLAGWVLRKK